MTICAGNYQVCWLDVVDSTLQITCVSVSGGVCGISGVLYNRIHNGELIMIVDACSTQHVRVAGAKPGICYAISSQSNSARPVCMRDYISQLNLH